MINDECFICRWLSSLIFQSKGVRNLLMKPIYTAADDVIEVRYYFVDAVGLVLTGAKRLCIAEADY